MTLAAVQTFPGTALVTTAEAVAVSTPGIPFQPTGQTTSDPGTSGIAIRGSLNITPGTGATSVTIRCRVGGLTGALVGLGLTVAVAAGNLVQIPFDFLDALFADAGSGYFITAQQAGASANGAVNEAYVEVDIIAP